jgi:hypothetical protein
MKKKKRIIALMVLTAVKMSIVIFWVIMPCGLVDGYQRFRGTYRLRLTLLRQHGATIQKTTIDKLLHNLLQH